MKMKHIPGSIGYVEFSYAISNNLNYVKLENKAGKFVPPTIDSFQAAADNADWSSEDSFAQVLVNQPGDYSWPITGASYILIYKDQTDPGKAKEMLKFFDWCYKHGSLAAKKLHYVPLPPKVVKKVEDSWEEQVKANGLKLWP